MKSKILIPKISLISFIYLFLILLTLYSRFINLNWGLGYGFHPDENNLWGASRRVAQTHQLDPEFYAYGGLPIYLYSLFPQKIHARITSAILQTAIVMLVFLTSRTITTATKHHSKTLTYFPTIMAIFSAGLIQAAHYLTVESLIGFFSMLIIFSLIKYHQSSKSHSSIKRKIWAIIATVSLGLGIGTKISFAVFALPFLSLFSKSNHSFKTRLSTTWALRKITTLILVFLSAISIFILTNPFIFTSWKNIHSTLSFETKVATGQLLVFYTRQFTDTIPGWFQTIHVFPSITSWVFIPLFIIGAITAIVKSVRPKTPTIQVLSLGLLSSLLSFLPVWAKWTRYVVQILPVLILVAGIGANQLWVKNKLGKSLAIISLAFFLPPFFSILSVYLQPDSRIQAAQWAKNNIPSNAIIFTEAMDLGILPFNPNHAERITLFNFYELDDDQTGQKYNKLTTLLAESNYFISTSRRVYQNSLDHPNQFPLSANFYRSLFDGSLGFIQIAQFDTNKFCIPHFVSCTPKVSSYEETFDVFDHPTIRIFKKTP